MQIKSFVFNPFYENTYVISSGGKALIFDPGCYEAYEYEEIKNYISANNLEIEGIVNTHCHIDHVLGNYELKKTYNAPLMIPKGEQAIFDAVAAYAPQWGITNYQPAEIDATLEEDQVLDLDTVRLRAIEVSGHSPGHLVFYEEKEGIVLGGDVLFRESIGRTDLPGGNHEDLINNIKTKVYTLPEEVTVYPGHGPETTIGYEKKYNPFVKG